MAIRPLAVATLLSASLLSGCYVNLAIPTPNVSLKLDADQATREGSASCNGFLWVFASGDCSVHTAMKNGRISKAHHVDARGKVILWGASSELTVTVYGE